MWSPQRTLLWGNDPSLLPSAQYDVHSRRAVAELRAVRCTRRTLLRREAIGVGANRSMQPDARVRHADHDVRGNALTRPR
jgi:hypothetical protein